MRKGSHMTDEQRARCSVANLSDVTYKTKVCLHCGKEYQPAGPTQQYCTECGPERKRETNRLRHEANREHDAKLAAAWYVTNRKPIVAWDHVFSPEWRAKLSAAGMGRPVSLETRTKMSAIMTGRVWSPEQRAKQWKGGTMVTNRKMRAKRRELGFLPLNQYFPGSDFHHLDIDHGVFIPHTLHQSVWHNHNTGRGMEQINALAYAYAGLPANVLDDTLPFD